MIALIVEDNADDRRLLRTVIEHNGHNIIEAEDGIKALSILKSTRPDLIISDAVMPGLDGFELLRRVKADDRLATIPFIFYSAVYTGFNEVNLALSLGAMAYIQKPKDPTELWGEIESLAAEGSIRRSFSSSMPESEFIRQYTSVVANKLQQKVDEISRLKAETDSAKKMLREVIDASRDAAFLLNKEGIVIDASSKSVQEVFGCKTSEFIGKSGRALFADDESWNEALKYFFNPMSPETGNVVDVKLKLSDETIASAESICRVVHGVDGEEAGKLILIRKK